MSITTTSTGTARRSTSRRSPRAARTHGVTSQGSPRRRHPVRTPTCTPSSPSMLPVIRPRSRRLTRSCSTRRCLRPDLGHGRRDSDEPGPQVSWGAPTGALFTVRPLQRLSRRSRHAGRSRHRRHDVHRYHAEPARRQLHLPGGRRRRRRHDRRRVRRRSPSSSTRLRPRRRAVSSANAALDGSIGITGPRPATAPARA